MTYPNYANVGDVIGRNLVTKPKFIDASRGAWTAGTSEVRSTPLGDRYRLGNFTRTSIKISDTFVPGVTYDVAVQGLTTSGATAYAYLTDRDDHPSLLTGNTKSAEFVTITGTDYAGIHTATITAPLGGATGTTGLWLQIYTATSGQTGFIAARVDEVGSTVTGMIDGDTADTSARDFAWDGAANDSSSKVTALTAFGTPPVAPTVDAGANQSITLPSGAVLDGTVSHGSPEWSKVSGPGDVTFADAAAVDTSATFSVDGSYVLRLTATDGDLTAFDEVAVTVAPAGGPAPAPVVLGVSGADVAAFLDAADDADLEALADQHVAVMTALVRAHTRGRGFYTAGAPYPDVRAVIITATARLVANPEQTDNYAGGAGVRGGFVGFTFPELIVLNAYRRRSA